MTGQTPFTITMALIDEISDTGVINEADVKSYKAKAPSILTILRNELSKGATILNYVVANLDQELEVDDLTATTVLPYGLAAHLMIEENPDIAGFFQSRYEELKKKLLTTEATTTDVYDTSLADDSSGW